MDVTDQLRKALTVLEDAEVPADLRAAALPVVFGALSSSLGRVSDDKIRRPSVDGELGGLDRIAARLSVPVELIEQAFVLEGDGVELVIPPGRFDVAKSRATEQIAVLIAAARQAMGTDADGWTSVEHIREACEHFRRHDSSNFATTIKEMDDVFTVRGTGRERKVRMTAPAWQRARELLAGLLGSNGSPA